MKKRQVFIVLLPVVLLLTAMVAQCTGKARERRHMIPADLATLIPSELPGWTVEDRPVADSPEMLARVESILSYDSAVFRIYRQGNTEISVYMSYWLPAKADENLVDAHTPDICWVLNGWKMEKEPALPEQETHRGEVPVPNVRNFTVMGTKLSVVYWHVVGDQIRNQHSIYPGDLPLGERLHYRISQMWNSITTPAGQQLFVRVSSNVPIEQEFNSAPVRACLDLVADTVHGKLLYTKR